MPFTPYGSSQSKPNIRPTPGFTPLNSSAFPTEEPPEIKRSFLQKLGQISIGAAKGLVGTAQTGLDLFGPIVNKIADPISHALGAKQTAPLQQSVPETWRTTTNNLQKVGYGIEQVAEAFVPIGGGAKVLKESPLIKNLAKEKVITRVFDAITPKVTEFTPTEYERLLSKGKILPKTATKPAQYILSDAEKQTAVKYQGLIKSKDPVKNTINVVEEIIKKDSEVGSFLSKKNAIFNNGELKNYILTKLQTVDDIMVDPKRLATVKESLVDNFIKTLGKNDQVTLWTKRKAFDRQIEKAFSGAPTLQNTIKREFRNAIQDFISSKTDDVTYKGYMKDMTELFNLKDVLVTKAIKEKALSGLKVWMKNHPNKTKAIEVIGGGTALYSLAKKLGILP